MRALLYFLGCFCCVAPTVVAQAMPPALTELYQDTWTTRDGLPHNSINGISQAADGRLWLATWEGAVRFNGQRFDIFDHYSGIGLQDAGLVNVKRNDQGGMMLMGARGTLVSQQWVDGQPRWVDFTMPSALIYDALFDQQGGVYAASSGFGLWYRNAQGEVRNITSSAGLSPLHTFALLQDHNRLWVGSSRGLLRIVGEQVTVMSGENGLPTAEVQHLAWYQDRLLVATEQGLYQQQGEQFTLLDPRLGGISFTTLWVDQRGDLWAGSNNDGLFRLSARGLEQLTAAQGLPNNRITALFEDSEGSLWVGTNAGLFRLRDAAFSTIEQSDGLAGNYVRTTLLHSDGSLWVGSSHGLSVLRDEQWHTIELPSGADSVLSLAEHHDGSMLIGTYFGGLLHWRDGAIVQRWRSTDGLLTNTISTLLVHRDHSIWVGTFNGVNVIYPDGRIVNFADDQREARLTIDLYQDAEQNVWIGTGRGLLRYSAQGFEFFDLRPFNQAEYVFDIQPLEPNALWLATDRGLLRFDTLSKQATVLSMQHGLKVDKLFQVQRDPYDSLWLTSNRGVMRLPFAQAQAVMAGESTHVTELDWYRESAGMISSQANGGSNPALAIDREGSVWVPTAHGLAHTHHQRVERYSEQPPTTLIERVSIDNQVSSENPTETESSTGAVTIQYAGIGFIVPERISYRTRLIGYDSNWRERGSQASAEYTNLAPGNYRFEVMASYNNGRSNGDAASFSFTVLPKYYQRAWFWVLVAVLLSVAMVALIQLRTRMLRRRAQLLEQQVRQQTEQLQAQALMFEQQSRQDSLTQLPNRRGFDIELQKQFTKHLRLRQPLSLAIIDIDHFKAINDQFSHQVGDLALQWLAAILLKHKRFDDVIARWGGEEFTLLMPQTTLAEARALCDVIRRSIAATPVPALAEERSMTISIGVASTELSASTQQLLADADRALYQAKHSGRNQVCALPSEADEAAAD